MNKQKEESILDNATMAEYAHVMAEALLDGDLVEARFRARLLDHQARTSEDPALAGAAADVVRLLGASGTLPCLGCGAAMLAFSVLLADRID